MHDTGLEAMQSLHGSQALRGIQHAQESSTTRQSIALAATKNKTNQQEQEDNTIVSDSPPEDDVDMGFGFAEMHRPSSKRKALAAAVAGEGDGLDRCAVPRLGKGLGVGIVPRVTAQTSSAGGGASQQPSPSLPMIPPENEDKKKHKDVQKATELTKLKLWCRSGGYQIRGSNWQI